MPLAFLSFVLVVGIGGKLSIVIERYFVCLANALLGFRKHMVLVTKPIGGGFTMFDEFLPFF